MAINLADTLKPMSNFPAAYAKHIEFDDGNSLQEKLDTGSLGGGGTGYTQLSQAEYDALSDDEKMNGKEYRTYDTGHIYKLGVEYGKDASADDIVSFAKPSQLGLDDTSCTVVDLINAMFLEQRKDYSKRLIGIFPYVKNESNITDLPTDISSKGQVKICTSGWDMASAKFTDTANCIEYIGRTIVASGAVNSITWKKVNTNTKGLVTNAQNFKIDLTKNTAAWYGMFTFNFTYGSTPCEITVAITDKVYYTVTKGQNIVSAITYTQDSANYQIGIDLTAKVYGTQVVEMPSEFATINSLTAETFAGTTSAIYKGAYSMYSYSSLADLGLDTSATINDICGKMANNSMFVYKTDVFDLTQYENLQFATVTIIKQGANRVQAIMTDKDAGDLYVGKMDSTNKIVGWNKATTNEILHTSLSGNLAGITTVLDLINALLTEYRALSTKKPIRFASGEITKTTLTDLPVNYGLLQITVSGYDVVEVRLAHSSFGFKSMYYGFINRISGEASISSLTWEKVATTDYVDSKVGKTTDLINENLSTLSAYKSGSLSYKSINGICYVSIKDVVFNTSTAQTLYLPVPLMPVSVLLSSNKSDSTTVYGKFTMQADTSIAKLKYNYDSSETPMSGSFSYPLKQ